MIIAFIILIVTMPIWAFKVADIISEYQIFNQKYTNYESIKITFKQFREFYAIAPNKWTWEFQKDYVENKKRIKGLKYSASHTSCKGYCIQFSFIDLMRFKKFVKEYDVNEKNKQDMSIKEDFMKYVQQDINNYNDELLEMLKRREK
jgi:hypothetical protein